MSSAVHLRSSSRSTPDKVIALPFPSTLTTMALDHCSLRWFETSSCKPIPRGLPSSSMKQCFHQNYGGRFRSAQYAIAFPRMSRSIVTRASSARKRLISICSAVTFDRLSGPQPAFSMGLDPVETSARPDPTFAMPTLYPDPTPQARTASRLNSSVYRARVAFVISISFANCQLRDTVRGGNISRGHNKDTITVPRCSHKHQKEPSVTLIFCKLQLSSALSRQRSFVTKLIRRRKRGCGY